MKKFFTVITLTILLIVMSLSVSGCNFLTISVDENGGQNTPMTETVLGKDVKISSKYQKRYDIESVALKSDDDSAVLNDEEVVSKIYNSVVTIKCPIKNGYQIGSGIIVDVDVNYKNKPQSLDTSNFVYIITCHHVIDGAKEFAVYLPKVIDGTTGEYSYDEYAFGATLIGGDKDNDIAVLRIEIEGYDDLKLTDIVKSKVSNEYVTRGETVFAIGNPGGDLPSWVSKGIISNVFVKTSVENIGEMTLIGLDASINHGNSGGGLFNKKGELVGIVNAGDTTMDGIGFAVPVMGEKGAKVTAESLIKTSSSESNGYIEGKWKLGASFSEHIFYNTKYVYVFNIDPEGSMAIVTFEGKQYKISENDYIVQIDYDFEGENYKCEMQSMDEFKTFYDVMQKRLTVGAKVNISYTSNFKTIKTGTIELKQYVYTFE